MAAVGILRDTSDPLGEPFSVEASDLRAASTSCPEGAGAAPPAETTEGGGALAPGPPGGAGPATPGRSGIEAELLLVTSATAATRAAEVPASAWEAAAWSSGASMPSTSRRRKNSASPRCVSPRPSSCASPAAAAPPGPSSSRCAPPLLRNMSYMKNRIFCILVCRFRWVTACCCSDCQSRSFSKTIFLLSCSSALSLSWTLARHSRSSTSSCSIVSDCSIIESEALLLIIRSFCSCGILFLGSLVFLRIKCNRSALPFRKYVC
mmetsp:Transcript_21989/g.38390  ORF Transcript_21989/g.38390 Transcript_21989/m.38390 type:complete len:264 (-) Transcript_21989:401-1192(-)